MCSRGRCAVHGFTVWWLLGRGSLVTVARRKSFCCVILGALIERVGHRFFEVGPNAFENPPKAIPARRGFLQVDLAASIVPFDPTFQPLSSAFPLPTPTIGATPSNGQVTPTASSSGIVFYSTVISIITGSTATISLITPISSPEPTAAVQLPPSPAHKISQTSLIAAVASASGIFVVVFVLILVWWCRRRRRRRRLEEKDSGESLCASTTSEGY